MKGNIEHRPTQNQRIIEYMRKHGSITTLEAMDRLGVARLASRICDMKRMGIPIHSTMVETVNRYGEKCRVKRYRLLDEEITTEPQTIDSEGK